MRKFLRFIGLPLTLFSALWLRFVKNPGSNSIEDKIYMNLGILPLIDHYYEPLINPKRDLKKTSEEIRNLNGIDLNIDFQLTFLKQLTFTSELALIPHKQTTGRSYFYQNNNFEYGDSDILYNMIRLLRPQNIIEVGGGFSSLIFEKAIKTNKQDDPSYSPHYRCIEPFENPWLLKRDLDLIHSKVEDLEISLFKELQANDVLFIDSSHMIRPEGDVLFELLEILPSLNSGVYIHIHDIFTPRNYPKKWLEDHKHWNEQYLLEAFLSCNSEFEIICSLNHLYKSYRKELNQCISILEDLNDINPGSFWIRKL